MKDLSKTLWRDFKKTFIEALDTKHILHNWTQVSKITDYYREELIPQIANKLNLHYAAKEYLLIDYVLSKKDKKETDDWEIPLIFIESENEIDSIHDSLPGEELFKLCCTNAPLKVIITKDDNWEYNSEMHIKNWSDIIIFTEVTQLVGYLAIIIIEKQDKNLFANYILFDDNADIIERGKLQ